MTEITLHPEISYQTDYIGNEREPVIVINNFINVPELLIEMAAYYGEFSVSEGRFYPGLVANSPPFYLSIISRFLSDIIGSTFNVDIKENVSTRSVFSMVLTPPHQLKAIQTVPHFDSLNRQDIAAVHYLCSPKNGGTSFYRHRGTGYESIDATRLDAYKSIADREMDHCRGKYMNGSNEFFEEIASYEAIFNRILIYRSTNLHSGNIAPDFNFDPNPRTGRLTLNTFIYNRKSSAGENRTKNTANSFNE